MIHLEILIKFITHLNPNYKITFMYNRKSIYYFTRPLSLPILYFINGGHTLHEIRDLNSDILNRMEVLGVWGISNGHPPMSPFLWSFFQIV